MKRIKLFLKLLSVFSIIVNILVNIGFAEAQEKDERYFTNKLVSLLASDDFMPSKYRADELVEDYGGREFVIEKLLQFKNSRSARVSDRSKILLMNFISYDRVNSEILKDMRSSDDITVTSLVARGIDRVRDNDLRLKLAHAVLASISRDYDKRWLLRYLQESEYEEIREISLSNYR